MNNKTINSGNVHRVDAAIKLDAIEFIMKNYWTSENFSRSVNLHLLPEAIDELRPFTEMLIDQGYSLCYIEDNKIAAVAVNVLQTIQTSTELFQQYLRDCRHPSAIAILQFVLDMEQYDEDIFKKTGVDCYLEIICIATSEACKGRGLAGELMKETVEFAKYLKNGNENLSGGYKPGAVVAECTSIYAKKITDKLNFTTLLDLESYLSDWIKRCFRPLSPNAILKIQALKL